MAGKVTGVLPVTWRDGVHITGTSIWCDALRARDVCFLSSARVLRRIRHGQLIATAATLTLLGKNHTGAHLAVPYGRPFTLGPVRLELIRSGHGLGGASLLVEVHGYRVIYASDVAPRGGGLGGAAEIRSCDVLVLGTHYGDPRFSFPPVDESVAQVVGFVEQTMARGGVAVLLIDSPNKALDVAVRLSREIGPVSAMSLYAQRAIHDAYLRLRSSHPELPRMRRHSNGPSGGHVLFWLIERRATLPRTLPEKSAIALISGMAMEPEFTTSLSVDVAYPWSDRADYHDLLQYIEATQPHQVFLTHRFAEPMAVRLAGASAPDGHSERTFHALGPPRQIALFGE